MFRNGVRRPRSHRQQQVETKLLAKKDASEAQESSGGYNDPAVKDEYPALFGGQEDKGVTKRGGNRRKTICRP